MSWTLRTLFTLRSGAAVAGLLWFGGPIDLSEPDWSVPGEVCAAKDDAGATAKDKKSSKKREKRTVSCERKCMGKERLRTHPLFKYSDSKLDWVVWGAMFVITYIIFLLIFSMMVRRGHDPLPVASGCFALTLLFATIEAAAVFGYQSVEKIDGKCWCAMWPKAGTVDVLKAFRWEIWGSAMGAAAIIALLLWLTFRSRSRS
jgi:hypothetical protein